MAVGGPPARGRLALVKIAGPAQVGSFGPKTVKVTVPVGAGALAGAVTKAVSVMGWPSEAFGVAWVTTVGGTGAMTEASLGALQGLVTVP
jgi:hypothetical protein